MRILEIYPTDVRFVTGSSSYFQEDFAAVKQSLTGFDPLAHPNATAPVTPGFKAVVRAGEVISILTRLPNYGGIAVGDCVDVIFSGAAGRDVLFVAEEHLPILNSVVRPWLLSCNLSAFRANAARCDEPWPELGGSRLHTAVRYGLSQALLAATALVRGCTITEVVLDEWDLSINEIRLQPINILASCHRGDTLQLDRMIMERLELIPHSSFVRAEDLGPRGRAFLEYVHSVAVRVRQRGGPKYRPTLHFDVYGTLGEVFTDDELPDFLAIVASVADPYGVLIESPLLASDRASQIQRLKTLRASLKVRKVPVQLVADEWCNTLEDVAAFADAKAVDLVQVKMPDLGSVRNSIDAVLLCRRQGMGCCLGGSANETGVSARITAQIAVTTQPNFLLSKPGIGADEGVMILTNEMRRTLALIRS